MGYTEQDWIERLRNRSDMSAYLYHLTRETDKLDTMEVLVNILNERELIGGTGFIVNNNKVVCFQDTTPYSLCQNCYHEQKLEADNTNARLRYSPIGLAFAKNYVYAKGGRPVLYEKTEIAKKILPSSEWWRIVNFDLTDSTKIIDWTHEREWRVKENFKFELKDTYVVLVNGEYYKQFINSVTIDMLKSLGGIIVLDPILT